MRWNRIGRGVRLAFLTLAVLLALPSVALAAKDARRTPFQAELLAKAPPDACFVGIGLNGPDTPPPCPEGQPKVNQAYVWGLTKAGTNLWFGTVPNVLCLGVGGFAGLTTPIQTNSFACEFGESWYSQNAGVPPILGDWRPPRIYTYDTAGGALTERSPVTDERFIRTLGLRSAGSIDDVVFLAGPALSTDGGINVFAFQASTQQYLGSTTLTQYDNIRSWIADNGALYTGVHNSTGGGSVIRWTGSLVFDGNTANLDTLFQFEVVGNLDADAANLAVHQNRIFVTTWPEVFSGDIGSQETTAGAQDAAPAGIPSSLWMSPMIPAGGLTGANAGQWQKVWSVSDYEPDPLIAMTYGGGALASYNGQLYWGTMHVPMMSTLAFIQTYGQPETTEGAVQAIQNTQRAISIFRGQNFGTSRAQVQMLYGETSLPAYNPQTDAWSNQRTGYRPVYGPSGFGNPFNNYTWTMGVYGGQLFVGTMDWSYLLADGLTSLLTPMFDVPLPPSLSVLPSRWGSAPPMSPGADLWRFPSGFQAATPQSVDGLGNILNYGIRTMYVAPEGLYMGTANPMNLRTTPGEPQGGWEVLRLR